MSCHMPHSSFPPVPPSPRRPLLSLRHLITASDDQLQIAFLIADEDSEVNAVLRIFGLSVKGHLARVIDRRLSEVVKRLFLEATRNGLISGRDHFNAFRRFNEKPLIASAVFSKEYDIAARIDRWIEKIGE